MNSMYDDYPGWLSLDGCRLYMSSLRAAVSGCAAFVDTPTGASMRKAWELKDVSGPHETANPDPNLGPGQVRYQATFQDTFNEEPVEISVNYDPDTNTFGIIKFASGK